MKASDYPLGPDRSRAAARMLLEQRRESKKWITLIDDLGEIDEPSFTPWEQSEDGNFHRLARIPPGMTIAEAERICEMNQRKLSTRKLTDGHN